MTAFNVIYGLRKELGLDDDTARDLYQREVGKRQLRDMTPGEQVRVQQALQRQARMSGKSHKAGPSPYAPKLRAMWISLWNLGLVRNRSDEALNEFVVGQSEVSHMRFLRAAKDGRAVVEALKSWLERGGVDWSFSVEPSACVLYAQGVRLGFDRLDLTNPSRDHLDQRLAPLAQLWWQWRQDGLREAEERDLGQRLGAEIRRRGDNGRAAR